MQEPNYSVSDNDLIQEFPCVGAIKSSNLKLIDHLRFTHTKINSHGVSLRLQVFPMCGAAASSACVERQRLVALNV